MTTERKPFKPCECGKCFATTWGEQEFKAAAHQLGFDPNKLQVRASHDPEFLEEIRERYGDENAAPAACCHRLTGIIEVFPDYIREGDEMETLAHEIQHACLDAIERQAESKGLGPQFRENLCLTAAAFGAPGGTEYVHKHWDMAAANPDEGDLLYLAVSETLSEMAAYYQRTGNLPSTKLWRNLYNFVRTTAKQLGVLHG